MEILINLLNPITLIIVAFIIVLGIVSSKYDVVFEDGEEIDF
jgi:hypothetical protein